MKTARRKSDGSGKRWLAPPSQELLEELRCRFHAGCMACSDPMYRLEFDCEPEGALVARFHPASGHCSYRGVVHGGVVGLLIDEAMTCCLMAHGVVGMTGELSLRYLENVEVEEIELRTRVTKSFAPLYHLESNLLQGGKVRVRGRGRFMQMVP